MLDDFLTRAALAGVGLSLATGPLGSFVVWRRMAYFGDATAHASGIRPERERLILTLALAVVVAVALKVVGALLIAAMLIIPAAAARALSRNPEAMASLAVVFGAAACLLGLAASLWQDTPAGPSIVAAAAVIFALSALFGRVLRA